MNYASSPEVIQGGGTGCSSIQSGVTKLKLGVSVRAHLTNIYARTMRHSLLIQIKIPISAVGNCKASSRRICLEEKRVQHPLTTLH